MDCMFARSGNTASSAAMMVRIMVFLSLAAMRALEAWSWPFRGLRSGVTLPVMEGALSEMLVK